MTNLEGIRQARRYVTDNPPGGEDYRTESQRDVNRVKEYSDYFQRLDSKTQIIAPRASPERVHSRNSHATKVSAMAGTIARHLTIGKDLADLAEQCGGLDPFVCEAAGAAHDIGHPPFGHIGEEVLNDFAEERGLDGFQGNAQSLRIVTKLDVHPRAPRGLDLTFATVNAIQKYPWAKGAEAMGLATAIPTDHYWGVYASEGVDVKQARAAALDSLRGGPTLEAQVMDYADDITYALHDFEDFYKLGLISTSQILAIGGFEDSATTLDRLRLRHSALVSEVAWDSAVDRFLRYIKSPKMDVLRSAYSDRLDQEAALRRLTSDWLSRWLSMLELSPARGLVHASDAWHEVMVMKMLTFELVIRHPRVRIVQEGHRGVLGELLSRLEDGLSTRDVAPTRLREYLRLARDDEDWHDRTEGHVKARAILDYVAWLTEPQIAGILATYRGDNLSLAASAWLR